MGFAVYIKLQNSNKRLRVRTRDERETFKDLRTRLRKEFSDTFSIPLDEMKQFGIFLDESGAAFGANACIEEELVAGKQYEFAHTPPTEKGTLKKQVTSVHASSSESDSVKIRAISKETEVVVFSDIVFSASSKPNRSRVTEAALKKEVALLTQQEAKHEQYPEAEQKQRKKQPQDEAAQNGALTPVIPLKQHGPFAIGDVFLAEFKDGLIYSGKVSCL